MGLLEQTRFWQVQRKGNRIEFLLFTWGKIQVAWSAVGEASGRSAVGLEQVSFGVINKAP